MKPFYLLVFYFFLNLSTSEGQKGQMHFGINADPIKLLEGTTEGVLMINLPKRITCKLSAGITYSESEDQTIKSRCAVAQTIDNRLEKGWYSKFSADYTLYNKKKIEYYIGGGLYYTSFQTRGRNTITGNELKKTGEIFAGGVVLGARIKYFNLIYFDFGLQAFHHKGDKYQIGNKCLGTIPGIGAPDNSNILSTFFFHVLFGK